MSVLPKSHFIQHFNTSATLLLLPHENTPEEVTLLAHNSLIKILCKKVPQLYDNTAQMKMAVISEW